MHIIKYFYLALIELAFKLRHGQRTETKRMNREVKDLGGKVRS